jgi:hypothetical protein
MTRRQIINNLKSVLMKTKVRRLLEIPARKHKREAIDKETAAEKSYFLVINLWIFRFEYSKEQSLSDS